MFNGYCSECRDCSSTEAHRADIKPYAFNYLSNSRWKRVENTGNTHCFPTRIPYTQSKLVTDNALNCSVTHYLPVYQSIQLIYQRESTRTFITAYQRSSTLKLHRIIVNQYKYYFTFRFM